MGFLKRLFITAALTVHLGIAWGLGSPTTDTETPIEHKVKAAYLFNFARFIQWPRSTPSVVESSSTATVAVAPFVVAVIGHDAFANEIKRALSGQVVEGQPLEIQETPYIDEIKNAQIVFIAQSAREQIPSVLQLVHDHPVLTVSETKDFVKHGGMIELGVENNKIQFTVNMQNVKRAGLVISSQMLQYGKVLDDLP